jgi:transcription elongation factor Elf1
MRERILELQCGVCGARRTVAMSEMDVVRVVTSEFLDAHASCTGCTGSGAVRGDADAEGGRMEPAIYDCGCSHLKVRLGRCDLYDERGRPRGA